MNIGNRNFVCHAKELLSSNNIHIIEELTEMSNLWINNRYHSSNKVSLGNNMGTGYFMSTLIRELYFILLKSNSNSQETEDLIKNSIYKNEIYLFNNICYVFDINKFILLFTSNKNDLARNYMREKCFYLTKDSTYWDKLERQLDLFLMNKGILPTREACLNNINKILLNAMDYALISGTKDTIEYNGFTEDLIKKTKKR